MVGKVAEERPVNVIKGDHNSEAFSAWAPDPLTGYYRPANHAVEIDPVELRQMLLNNKVRPLQNMNIYMQQQYMYEGPEDYALIIYHDNLLLPGN